jgi:hypothetical protein
MIRQTINSRRMRWVGHVARMGAMGNAYKILIGKPEGKRPLGRQRRIWKDNTRMDLTETGREGVDWMQLLRIRTSGGLL